MVIECLGYRRRASPSHAGTAMRKAGCFANCVGFERGGVCRGVDNRRSVLHLRWTNLDNEKSLKWIQ